MDIPEQPQQSPELPAAIAAKPKKSRSFFKLMLAFLLGAVAYAVIVGAWNLTHRNVSEDNQGITVQQVTYPAAAPQNTSVSQDDLKKYVTPVDCTTLPNYSNLSTFASFAGVQSISLYDGIRAQTGNSAGTYLWKTLPVVVDYKCSVIKITDIAVGDRVNFYTSKGVDSSVGIRDIKLIQKANL